MEKKSIITLVATALFFTSTYGSTDPNPKLFSPDHTVKIALLLDTSNSMDGLINQAKAQLWDIVNEFTYARCGNEGRPGLQIALYQYGNDYLPAREGYIQQVLGFTSDLDEISKQLFSLTTNGGEEFCGQVIHTSLRQLDWGRNRNDLKFIFIAGNEPFTQGKINYRDAVLNAKEKDIVINTIFCGDYHQGVNTRWQEGALLTGGDYMAIDHNREVVHIRTPYDKIIINLNSRLNKTYVSYGPRGAAKVAAQAEQDANAMAMDQAVAVNRAVSKSSAYYSNSSWDLVDASESEDFDAGELTDEQLPAELKGKSAKAITSYLDGKKRERAAIQKEIKEVNAKRDAYIAAQAKSSDSDLKSAMMKSIRKHAAKKNYSWDK